MSGCQKLAVDTQPIWHPFVFNPNLHITSLVDHGYRCMDMPCGQPQFVKTVGDTMIQYDLSSIDCGKDEANTIGGFLLNADELEEVELRKPDSVFDAYFYLSDSLRHFQVVNSWKERTDANPYYPFIRKEVVDCYQGINFRVYTILLNKVDSMAIIEFVEKHDARMTKYQNWNSKAGGSFMVRHIPSGLYFDCELRKNDYYTWRNEVNWELSIVSEISYLDHKRPGD